MSDRVRIIAGALILSALVLPVSVAGQDFFRRFFSESLPSVEYNSHFAFTRIRYGARVGPGASGWEHDYPTADRNFSAILDYITNTRVHLDGSNILDLDDPRIFENPVIYMSEPGYWTTDEAEAANLRAYLLKGGFIIFDDFDGDADWQNMATQMKRVLPEHHFIRLDVTHPIFQSFFGLKTLNIPHPLLPGIPASLLRLVRRQSRIRPHVGDRELEQRHRRLLGMVGRRVVRGCANQRRLSAGRQLSRLRDDPLKADFEL